jgi:hypothetical protein
MVADPETIAAQADADFANAMLGIPSRFSPPYVEESTVGNIINRYCLNNLIRNDIWKNLFSFESKREITCHFAL